MARVPLELTIPQNDTNNDMTDTDLYTVKDVAGKLRIQEQSARLFLKRHPEIRTIKIGKRVRVSKADFDLWIRARFSSSPAGGAYVGR